MTEQTQTLYALVDISNLEATSFLKRAPMREILAWQKIFAQEGKPTKRLDLITDLQSLQYLYWNSTGQHTGDQPGDVLDTLIAQCAEAATKLAIDETSEEEFKARLPEDSLKSAGDKRREGENMSEGTLLKPSEKAGSTKKAGKTDGEKAAEKAAKETAKTAIKAKKEADRAEAKRLKNEAKANKPITGPKVKPVIDAKRACEVFAAIGDDRASALTKVQEAFLAQVPSKTGAKSSDVRGSYAVSVPLKLTNESPLQDTLVSLYWLASVISGLKSTEYLRYHSEAAIQRLGFVILKDGTQIPQQPTPEQREAKKVEREAAKVAAKAAREAEAKVKGDAIAEAAHTQETDAQTLALG